MTQTSSPRSLTSLVYAPETSQAVHHNFEVKDNKGREIGVVVTTYEVDFLPTDKDYGYLQPAGHYLAANVHVSRDGKTYGSSQRTEYFKTEEERTSYTQKRV